MIGRYEKSSLKKDEENIYVVFIPCLDNDDQVFWGSGVCGNAPALALIDLSKAEEILMKNRLEGYISLTDEFFSHREEKDMIEAVSRKGKDNPYSVNARAVMKYLNIKISEAKDPEYFKILESF